MSILNKRLLLNKKILLNKEAEAETKTFPAAEPLDEYIKNDHWNLYFRDKDGGEYPIPYSSIFSFEVETDTIVCIKKAKLSMVSDYLPIIGTEVVITFYRSGFVISRGTGSKLFIYSIDEFKSLPLSIQEKGEPPFEEGYTLYITGFTVKDVVEGKYLLDISIDNIADVINEEKYYKFTEALSYFHITYGGQLIDSLLKNATYVSYPGILKKNNIKMSAWVGLEYLIIFILDLKFRQLEKAKGTYDERTWESKEFSNIKNGGMGLYWGDPLARFLAMSIKDRVDTLIRWDYLGMEEYRNGNTGIAKVYTHSAFSYVNIFHWEKISSLEYNIKRFIYFTSDPVRRVYSINYRECYQFLQNFISDGNFRNAVASDLNLATNVAEYFDVYRSLSESNQVLLEFIMFSRALEETHQERSVGEYFDLFCQTKKGGRYQWTLNHNKEIEFIKVTIVEKTIDTNLFILSEKNKTNKVVNKLQVNYEFDLSYNIPLNDPTWETYKSNILSKSDYTLSNLDDENSGVESNAIFVEGDSEDNKEVSSTKSLEVKKIYNNPTSQGIFGVKGKAITVKSIPTLQYDYLARNLLKKLSFPYPSINVFFSHEDTLRTNDLVVHHYPTATSYIIPPEPLSVEGDLLKNKVILRPTLGCTTISIHCYGLGAIGLYFPEAGSEEIGGYKNLKEVYKQIFPNVRPITIRQELITVPSQAIDESYSLNDLVLIKDKTIDVLYITYDFQNARIPNASFETDGLVAQKKKLRMKLDGSGWEGKGEISMSKVQSIEQYFKYYKASNNIDL